jgi:hypothetical protein
MNAGFLATQSQQISWLLMFGNSATASRLSLIHSSKFCFVRWVLSGHLLPTMLVHLGETQVRPTSWKHWPIRLNSIGLSSFLASESKVKIFTLKSGSMNVRNYLGPNHAWSGTRCCVMSSNPFLKEILIQSGCFRPSLINMSDMRLLPRSSKCTS